MKYDELAVLDALTRASRFVTVHADALQGLAGSPTHMEMDELIDRLRGYGVTQRSHAARSRGETALQRQSAAALRNRYLVPIVAIARARSYRVPELNGLRLPDIRLRGDRFIAAARALGLAASRHREVLVKSGMDADFEEQLESAISALERSYSDRDSSVQAGAAATTAAAVDASEGRAVLRTMDALIRSVLPDGGLLTTWENERRIRRRPGPRSGGTAGS